MANGDESRTMPTAQKGDGFGIASIIRWTVFVGLLWGTLYFGLLIVALMFPEQQTVAMLIPTLLSIGQQLGSFVAPVLQLALIIFILIAAAQQLGFAQDTKWVRNLGSLSSANNVQAFIAVTIILGVVVGALADIQALPALKDLALVVVGFYFGTRKRQGDVEDAAAIAVAEAERRPPARDPDQNPSAVQG